MIEPTDLQVQRDISFNDSQRLSKESEEVLLYRDMQTDLVQQLMRRIAAAKPYAAAQLSSWPAHLERGRLARCYVVCGDEALLTLEAQDAIRRAARAQGYAEREVLHADARMDWSTLEQARRQSVPVFQPPPARDPPALGQAGQERGARRCRRTRGATTRTCSRSSACRAWTGPRAPPNGPPRCSRRRPGSTWRRSAATACPNGSSSGWRARGSRRRRRRWRCWPTRSRAICSPPTRRSRKLHLLYGDGPLSLEQIRAAIFDVARFEGVSLPVAMLAGDRQRILRTVAGLRAEGEPLPLLLWIVSEELRNLLRLHQGMAAGRPFAAVARTVAPGRAGRAGRAGPAAPRRRARWPACWRAARRSTGWSRDCTSRGATTIPG